MERLLRGESRIAELVLEGPDLRLVRAADGYIELPALPASSEPSPSRSPRSPPSPCRCMLQSLSIRDTAFHLADAAGGADLVDFALKELGFSDLRLEGAKVGLGGIRISEPVLRVRREVQATKAGARGSGAPAPTPAAGDEAGAPPDLRIDDLEIERAEFSVLTDGEPVSVALRLKTTGVSLAPDAPFPLDLGLEAGDGSLALKGQLGLNPLVWDGKLAWQGLAVPMCVRVALPDLIPWIRSCSASGDLDVKLRLVAGGGAAPGLRASGRIGVDDFAVEDPEQELALGWKSLAIELKDASVPLDGAERADPGGAREDRAHAAVGALRAAQHRVRAAPEEHGRSAAGRLRLRRRRERGRSPAPEPRITIDSIEVRGGSAEFDRPLRQGAVPGPRARPQRRRGWRQAARAQRRATARARHCAGARALRAARLAARCNRARSPSSSNGCRSRSSRPMPRAPPTCAFRRASSRST